MRGAVLALALLGSLGAACGVADSVPTANEVSEQQQREDDAWRQGCDAFKREVADRTGGEPLRDPSQFPDVFDQMLEDAGAPESFREDARELADKTPPSPEADPETFREYMEKFSDKCSEVGTPID